MTIPNKEVFTLHIINYKDVIKLVYFHNRNKNKVISNSEVKDHKLFCDKNGEIIDKEAYYLSKSLDRTKRNIKDIVLSNHWNYFITLTINPKKYDSSVLEVAKKLIQYFERELRKHNCKFIIIPEYHEDKKKLHFHGLISGVLPVSDSGCVKVPNIKKPLRLETCKARNIDLSNAKKVYNIPNWKYGFASIIKVGENALDNVKLSNYITKYITKDLLTLFNKHRYYCSKSVERPRVIYQTLSVISDTTPPIATNYGSLITQYHNEFCFVQYYEKPNDIDFAFDNDRKVAELKFLAPPF